jgi:alpha-amylase
MHTKRIQDLFGQTPTFFRNTELIYNNELAQHVSQMKDASGNPRFHGIICEGVDRKLGFRSPNYVYAPPGTWSAARAEPADPSAVLLKNYRLSDDIAFRFSNRGWAEWPLSAEKFAKWVNQINGDGYLCNLFMDYETFGEHQWADTGIFQFLEPLPEAVFDVAKKPDGTTENHFITPSRWPLKQFEPVGVYDVHDYISWADTERDLTAWRGNAMQWNALEETYRLEAAIKDAPRRGTEIRRLPPPSPRPSTSSKTGASSPPPTTSTTCAPSTGPTATCTSTSGWPLRLALRRVHQLHEQPIRWTTSNKCAG